MSAFRFQVYQSDESCRLSPKLVRSSVGEIQDRSLKNGFNAVVFPEREITAQYFIVEYVLRKIVSGRLGNIKPLSNCEIGCKLRIGTQAIDGCDKSAVVQFGGICEDVADDPRICICVPNRGSRGLLREYIPLRYAHLFQMVETNLPLTQFAKYYRIKTVVSRDESTLQRLANVRSYLTRSVLCVVPSLRVVRKLSNSFSVDGFDLSSCVLIGSVCGDEVRILSRGQIAGIPSLLVCTDLVAALEYVERHPETVESVIIDLPNIERTLYGDALYRLQDLCPQITVLTDFAGAEGISELVDYGFELMQWDRNRLAETCVGRDSAGFVDDWAVNFMSSSVTVEAMDDLLLETAFEWGRKLSLPPDDVDPVIGESFVSLNNYMFSLLRSATPLSRQDRESLRVGIREAICRPKSDRRFVSDETIAGYESWAEVLEQITDRTWLAKQQEVGQLIKKSNGRRLILVVDDRTKDISCEGIEIVRRCDFPLLEASLGDAIVVVVGWFGAAKMRNLLFSPKMREAKLLLYGCERRWLRSRLLSWCREFGHEPADFGFVLPEEPEQVFGQVASPLAEQDMQAPQCQPVRERHIPQVHRKPLGIIPRKRQLDELEIIEFGLCEYADRVSTVRDRLAESVPVLRYELSGGHRAYFKSGHRVVCATAVIQGLDKGLETKSADDLCEGECIVDVSVAKDLIRGCADDILRREGHVNARETAGKWKEALRAELAFAKLDDVVAQLRDAGCVRSTVALQHWLEDDNFIGPSSVQDLEAIAELTKRTAGAYLVDHAETVAEAIRLVKSAHTAAGGELSRRMRSHVKDVISRSGVEDPFATGESVLIMDSQVGAIRLHRVCGPGVPQVVKPTMVNRIVSF